MANDLTKSPNQIILEVVNAKTSRGFVEATFTWTELPVVNLDGPQNTSLTLIAAPGSGYRNNRVIFYNRLHLTTGMAVKYVASKPGRDLNFTAGDATTVGELVPELNQRFNINLTDKDVDFTQPFPAFEGTAGETQQLVIPALPDSLIWIGSLTIALGAGDIDLELAIQDQEMDGLIYTPPE